ncbi:unnamed protein product [Mycena citricolor]|uniref:Pentatricopeptide repeat-containing protein n=1 Tax=Mycena citricolor TaxID=2018698 RepID=A0AAD2Q627_9AGAR|nr:unnamed protein product [Mycena citricolor]
MFTVRLTHECPFVLDLFEQHVSQHFRALDFPRLFWRGFPDEPNLVRKHYLPLVEELERIKADPTAPPPPSPLTRHQIITLLDMLATSGRPADIGTLKAMFAHLPLYFGIPITPDLHTAVISAFLKQGYVRIAVSWIASMPDLPPHVHPGLEHFHTLLKGCPIHVQIAYLRDIVMHKMPAAGVQPEEETFAILTRRMIQNARENKKNVPVAHCTGLFSDMQAMKLACPSSILDLMTDFYMSQGLTQFAEAVRADYVARFPQEPSADEKQLREWQTTLFSVAQSSGIEVAANLIDILCKQGLPRSGLALLAILGPSSTSVEDLRTAEKASGISASASEYAFLINNCLRTKRLGDAQAIYEQARAAGIAPAASMVGPIIRALTSGGRNSAHDTNVDAALTLYTELDEAFSSDSAGPENSPGPTLDIYTCLMHGLANCSNVKTAYPIAQALLSDMESRKMTSNQSIMTSRVILEMCSADSLELALKAYRKHYTELTDMGYWAVLTAFVRFSFTLGYQNAMEYFYIIISDMEKAGFRMNDRLYTNVLRQLSEVASARRKEWRQKNIGKEVPPKLYADILDATRQLHNSVVLDSMIRPGMPVWNEIMGTYQRLGAFADAYRMWQHMFLTRSFGSITVSTILESCDSAERAQSIVADLLQSRYELTLHNWNAYVECLAKNQNISEALYVICEMMGSGHQPVKADASTVSVVLKSATTEQQRQSVLQTIERQRQPLYASLPESMTRPP